MKKIYISLKVANDRICEKLIIVLEFDRGTRDYRIAISVLESHDTAKDVTVSVSRNLPVKTFAK